MNNNALVKPVVIVVGIFVALFLVGKFLAPQEPPPPVPAALDPAAEAQRRKDEIVSRQPPPQAGEALTSDKAKLGAKAVTTKSGLKYEDLVVGSGTEAKDGTTVDVHYTGWLTDGTKFDSSHDRSEPFSLSLPGQVISGWNEGIPGMKVGGKRKLVIPSILAYGDTGSGAIPGGATLVFEIELLKVK